MYCIECDCPIPGNVHYNSTQNFVLPLCREAKVHIEVDSTHHNYNHLPALSNLKNNFSCFQKGYITLKIPNSLMYSKAEETADYITGFLELKFEKATENISLLNLFK